MTPHIHRPLYEVPPPLRVFNLVHKNWTVHKNYPQKGNAFIEMNASFDTRIKVCIKALKKGKFIGKLTKFENDHRIFTS